MAARAASPGRQTGRKQVTRRAAAKTRPAAKTGKSAAPPPGARQTVMVTGAGGALGRRVIKRLKEFHNVVGVDFRWRRNLDPEVVHYEVDFNKRSFEDVFRAHKIDGIVHLGRIPAKELDRNRRYNSNVLGTERLFKLASKYGVKQVLVLSTHFVYGAHPYNPALIDEGFPLKAAGVTAELIDSVELENLANIHLYKNPDLHITILRPCQIVGPEVSNTMSRLMGTPYVPCLAGFSPVMQFIHVSDMADAVVTAYQLNRPGVYNVAPDDWVALQEALRRCGCTPVPLPSVPPVLPRILARLLGRYTLPPYLLNYLKYPVVLDGSLFRATFGFEPRKSLDDIFAYYRNEKTKTEMA